LLIAVSSQPFCPVLPDAILPHVGGAADGCLRVLLAAVFLAAMMLFIFWRFCRYRRGAFGKDYDFYAAMPIRSSEVFFAKFLFAYAYDLMISLFFTVPLLLFTRW
jgi:hypothetical protein